MCGLNLALRWLISALRWLISALPLVDSVGGLP